jgi:hypothetical protein
MSGVINRFAGGYGMSFRLLRVPLVVVLSCCSMACGTASRSVPPAVVASDGAAGGRGGPGEREGDEPGKREGSERQEREPAAVNSAEFVPLSAPVPEHGVARGVRADASDEVHLAAEAGAAREGNVASSEQR